MAGAGYKLFNTGDVLTAAQVNTYLQEQAVMRFANSTARTTALSGVLAEGMVSYLDDTNAVEVYNGSAWVSVGSTGDITGVTAGTGISGGGTSGDVTITNSMATAIDAKGDLIVGTGADTFSRLAVGATNGHTLQVDSSTATGLKWAAAAGGGKVLQVVSATYSTSTTVSSTTWTDTGLSASITPSATSSKILILVSQPLELGADSGQADLGGGQRILRGSTFIYGDNSASAPGTSYVYLNTSAFLNYIWWANLTYLDSPSTTSSTTYKTQIAANSTAGNERIKAQGGSNTSSIILMEIGA